ncbi:MAG TPA: hypothetical protein VF353_09525, partial [Candidatus Binatia bacterium]
KCRYNASDGARDLYNLFQSIDMTRDVFDFRAYTRLKQLQHLLRTGQIDDQFYWVRSNNSRAVSENQVGDHRARATG